MSILSDLIVGKKTNEHGSQTQSGMRTPLKGQYELVNLLIRQLLGQTSKPPNTAISVPEQQAISALQGGPMALATPMGQTQGLQSREQLGLPDRSTYTPSGFVPTSDQIKAIGLPPVQAMPSARKDQRQYRKATANEAKGGKKGEKAAKKAAGIQKKHPEWEE